LGRRVDEGGELDRDLRGQGRLAGAPEGRRRRGQIVPRGSRAAAAAGAGPALVRAARAARAEPARSSAANPRFEFQTRSRSAAICSRVRPVLTLSGRSWVMS
jgi:hypothetical protein